MGILCAAAWKMPTICFDRRDNMSNVTDRQFYDERVQSDKAHRLRHSRSFLTIYIY